MPRVISEEVFQKALRDGKVDPKATRNNKVVDFYMVKN
jgi:hypothetical protein